MSTTGAVPCAKRAEARRSASTIAFVPGVEIAVAARSASTIAFERDVITAVHVITDIRERLARRVIGLAFTNDLAYRVANVAAVRFVSTVVVVPGAGIVVVDRRRTAARPTAHYAIVSVIAMMRLRIPSEPGAL